VTFRLFIVAAGAILLVALFILLRPVVAPQGPAERSIAVTVSADGMEPKQIAVGEGDRVTLRLTVRSTVRFHLHGYDIERDLSAGTTETVELTATLTGRFEIEDEATKTVLGELVVEPRGR